jgi:hypothetical protein
MKKATRLSARLLAITLAACAATAATADDAAQAVTGNSIEPTTIADYSDTASQPPASLLSAPQYIQQQRAANYGPRMYFQTEATFLSRKYDQPETEFRLFNTDEIDVDVAYDVDGNFESVDWDVDSTDQTAFLSPGHELADQLTASPRLSLGIVGASGWGIQGRYWRMENSVGNAGSLIDFDTYTNENDDVAQDELDAWYRGQLSQTSDFERFNVQTIDLEGSKDFSVYAWRGLATFGARYADVNNVRHTTVDGAIRTGTPGYDPGNGNDVMQDTYHTADYDFATLQSMNFHGAGPTFSLTGIRPLTESFSLFTSGRGSVLFGDSRNFARADGQMSSLFDDEEEGDSEVINSTEELFIAELQLGGQWSRPVRFINGHFFARGAFEYQFWRNSTRRAYAVIDGDELDDFNSTHTIINNDIESGIGTTQGNGIAYGLEPDFDLIGFSLSTGFVW